MKIEIEMPEIEGHEYTGEYRRSKNGEPYRNSHGNVESCLGGSNCCYFILKKKEPIYRIVGGPDGIGVHVEIRALQDAMEIGQIPAEEMTNSECVQWIALKELIK